LRNIFRLFNPPIHTPTSTRGLFSSSWILDLLLAPNANSTIKTLETRDVTSNELPSELRVMASAIFNLESPLDDLENFSKPTLLDILTEIKDKTIPNEKDEKGGGSSFKVTLFIGKERGKIERWNTRSSTSLIQPSSNNPHSITFDFKRCNPSDKHSMRAKHEASHWLLVLGYFKRLFMTSNKAFELFKPWRVVYWTNPWTYYSKSVWEIGSSPSSQYILRMTWTYYSKLVWKLNPNLSSQHDLGMTSWNLKERLIKVISENHPTSEVSNHRP